MPGYSSTTGHGQYLGKDDQTGQKYYFDPTQDRNQLAVLKGAQRLIGTQAAQDPRARALSEAFVNSPPGWMTTSDSVSGARGGTDNLDPAQYQAFVDYEWDVIQHYHEHPDEPGAAAINFQSLELFNEPDTDWGLGTHQEAAHFGPEARARILELLAQKIKDYNNPANHEGDAQFEPLDIKISASDENNVYAAAMDVDPNLSLDSFRGDANSQTLRARQLRGYQHLKRVYEELASEGLLAHLNLHTYAAKEGRYHAYDYYHIYGNPNDPDWQNDAQHDPGYRYPGDDRNDLPAYFADKPEQQAIRTVEQWKKKHHQQLWISESEPGDNDTAQGGNPTKASDGINLSRRIIGDLKSFNPTAWIYWQAIEALVGGNNTGLMRVDFDRPSLKNLYIAEEYYALGNFSAFVRPGYQMIAIGDPESVAFVGGGQLVIVSVARKEVHFDLRAFGVHTGTAQGYTTGAREGLAPGSATIAEGTLTHRPSANATKTYVVALGGGMGGRPLAAS